MKFFRFVLLILICALSAFSTEVDRLLSEYGQIESVTCHIRRTVTGDAGSIQFISRVYWQNDDKLHVDNLSPIPRRIISDGDTFFSYAKGDPKGFSRPVSELSDEMLISLRKIPGTPMDHLLLLKGTPEEYLSPHNGVRRVGYSLSGKYIVMGIDSDGRLIRLDFYKTRQMNEKTAGYEYSNFAEVTPSVWIPKHHIAHMNAPDGSVLTETIRMDELFANRPIAVSLFKASSFFDKDIDFVGSFSEIYKQ